MGFEITSGLTLSNVLTPIRSGVRGLILAGLSVGGKLLGVELERRPTDDGKRVSERLTANGAGDGRLILGNSVNWVERGVAGCLDGSLIDDTGLIEVFATPTLLT